MSLNRTAPLARGAIVTLLLVIAGSLALGGCKPSSAPKSSSEGASYQFELVGAPQKTAPGIRVVSVRLVHLPDKKPVRDAVIFETRADMGPDGMVAMTAPVRALPEPEPGIYPFEIEFGPVWNRPGDWALLLAAKVQGETETVRGSVTVNLEP